MLARSGCPSCPARTCPSNALCLAMGAFVCDIVRGRSPSPPAANRVPAQRPLPSHRCAAHPFNSGALAQVLPSLDLAGRVLAMRVLALALCLDGHVNLPDRFFFVRCARAAGMPVDRKAMAQFRSLERLFGAGALNASALAQLFVGQADANLNGGASGAFANPLPQDQAVTSAYARTPASTAQNVNVGSRAWWSDLLMTVFAR